MKNLNNSTLMITSWIGYAIVLTCILVIYLGNTTDMRIMLYLLMHDILIALPLFLYYLHIKNTTTPSEPVNKPIIEFTNAEDRDYYRYFQVIDEDNILIDGKVMATPVQSKGCDGCMFIGDGDPEEHCFDIPCTLSERNDGRDVMFVIKE